MKTVGVFDAKTRLSELIESGETLTITKHGRPVATLARSARIRPTWRPVYGRTPASKLRTEGIATMVREGS
jgi:antitoxin (DNA-binding transcriptional repressor) of toxin-antitoxin stability system